MNVNETHSCRIYMRHQMQNRVVGHHALTGRWPELDGYAPITIRSAAGCAAIAVSLAKF